jgi:hypothetical protein
MKEVRYRELNQVQFESDLELLGDAINMKRRGNSEFLSIVHDIVIFMSSFLNLRLSLLQSKRIRLLILLLRQPNFGLASIDLRLFPYVLNINSW